MTKVCLTILIAMASMSEVYAANPCNYGSASKINLKARGALGTRDVVITGDMVLRPKAGIYSAVFQSRRQRDANCEVFPILDTDESVSSVTDFKPFSNAKGDHFILRARYYVVVQAGSGEGDWVQLRPILPNFALDTSSSAILVSCTGAIGSGMGWNALAVRPNRACEYSIPTVSGVR